MANTDLISSLKTLFLKISFEKCPKVTLWVENRFLSMFMIISEEFHIDPESLKPWVERGQKVTLTVNNAKHDQSQTLDFLKVRGQRKFFFRISGHLDFGTDAFDWLNLICSSL